MQTQTQKMGHSLILYVSEITIDFGENCIIALKATIGQIMIKIMQLWNSQ